MDLGDWQLLQDRLDRAHKNTLNMNFGIKDLWRMHRAVYDRLRLADAEWVNCRRRGQGSPKFDASISILVNSTSVSASNGSFNGAGSYFS